MVQYFNPGDNQSLLNFADALQQLVKKNIEQKMKVFSIMENTLNFYYKLKKVLYHIFLKVVTMVSQSA